MYSAIFAAREPSSAADSSRMRLAEEKLISDARFLEKSGATAIAIPCNTSHYFYDAISGSVEIEVINMVRETARYVKELGRKRV